MAAGGFRGAEGRNLSQKGKKKIWEKTDIGLRGRGQGFRMRSGLPWEQVVMVTKGGGVGVRVCGHFRPVCRLVEGDTGRWPDEHR